MHLLNAQPGAIADGSLAVDRSVPGTLGFLVRCRYGAFRNGTSP